MRRASALLLPLLLISTACQQAAQASEKPVRAPAAKLSASESPGLKTAVFAGGCFWGVEGVFSHIDGVTSAVSGYHGGDKANANYSTVSSGATRHAEAVKVTYDPAKVRYDQLLRVFFSVIADPTQLNRQGPDSGPQYRSAIIPVSAAQKNVATAYIAQLGKAGLWEKPIVTKIESYRHFYPAERYHQDFMAKNPDHRYIQAWDAPKVRALRTLYPDLYKATFTKG